MDLPLEKVSKITSASLTTSEQGALAYFRPIIFLRIPRRKFGKRTLGAIQGLIGLILQNYKIINKIIHAFVDFSRVDFPQTINVVIPCFRLYMCFEKTSFCYNHVHVTFSRKS